MDRQSVQSSNVASIGYSDGTLEVEFKNGSVYQYAGVPGEVYLGLLAADSKGSYVYRMVRSTYKGVRV